VALPLLPGLIKLSLGLDAPAILGQDVRAVVPHNIAASIPMQPSAKGPVPYPATTHRTDDPGDPCCIALGSIPAT